MIEPKQQLTGGTLVVIGGLIAGMAGARSRWAILIIGFIIFIMGRFIG